MKRVWLAVALNAFASVFNAWVFSQTGNDVNLVCSGLSAGFAIGFAVIAVAETRR